MRKNGESRKMLIPGGSGGLGGHLPGAPFARWSLLLCVVLALGWIGAGADVAPAKWRNVGPWIGDVATVVLTPSNPRAIFAGTWLAGVYKSADGGNTWEAARRGLPEDISVFSMVLDPYDERTLYAGTLDILGLRFTGVYKSSNAGSSWTAVNRGIARSAGEIWAIGATPWKGGAILAGGVRGIFRTRNRGLRWEKATVTGYVDPWVRSFATDPAHAQQIYAACAEGILRSSDGGATWAPSDEGIPDYGFAFTGIAVDPESPSILYATRADSIWRSTDSAETWTMVRPYTAGGGDYDSVAVDPSHSGTVYVGLNWRGVLKTPDSGATWTLMTKGLPKFDNNPAYMDLSVDPRAPSTVYAATTLGVYRSDDAGATWVDASRGLTAVLIEEVVLDRVTPTLLYARADSLNESIISRSTDGGATWEKIYPGLSGYTPSRPRADLVATGGPESGVVYRAGRAPDVVVHRSRNAGQSWKRVFARVPQPSHPKFLASHPANPHTIYMGISAVDYPEVEADGVFRSDDGGDTWRRLARLPRGEGFPSCVALYPSDRRVLYVGGYSGVYGSEDGGASWTDVTSNLPENPSISALAVDPSSPEVLYAGSDRLGLFRTADGGHSWRAVNTGLRDKHIAALAIDPSDTSILYVATWSTGVYKTHDAGQTWKSINAGIFSESPRSIAIDPGDPRHVYVGCWGSGVYETTTGGE